MKDNQSQPSVAVIVLGYNSRAFLEDCFKTILASSYPSLRILYVDNRSSDDSAQYVKKHFPNVHVLELPHNLGFAGGNNAGITEALAQGAGYIMLLNPDTEIAPDAIEKLMEQADQQTVLQPLILLHSDKKTDLVNTTGNHIHYLGVSYVGDYKAPRATIHAKSIATASGAACLIPRSVFAKVGQLDDLFFMYQEDVDFCWRARVAGFQVRLVPESLVWHHYEFSRNARKMYYAERNRLLFLTKNYQLHTLLLIMPMLILHEILTCLFALKEGWFITKMRIYKDYFYLLPSVLRERRAITHTVSDSRLKLFLNSKLDFAEVRAPLISQYNWLLELYWRLIRGLI